MSGNAVYVRVVLVVMVVAVLVSFLGRGGHPAPHSVWVPSSFNPVGAGNRAFYQTLEDLRWPVERWREPLSRLSARGTGNALLITRSSSDYRVAFTKEEDELLDQWVAAGNTLFLLGSMAKWEDTRDLLAQFGIDAPKPEEDSKFFDDFHMGVEKKIEAAPESGQVGRLVLPKGAFLPVSFPKTSKLLWSNGGSPEALEFDHGKGRVVCIASDLLLANRYLPEGDNLAIVLSLLAPGRKAPGHLFFEERHHGFTPGFALAQLAHHPGVRLAGLLTMLGGLCFVGSTFMRFGPVLPLEAATGRSSLEYIDSIAALYQGADLRNETMRFLFENTRRVVVQRLHLPDGAAHEVVSARLKRAFPDLPSWKKLAHRFDSQDYVAGLPPGGWLRVARELIQIKTAVA